MQANALSVWLAPYFGLPCSPVTVIVSGAAVYLSLVQLLRFRNVRALQQKYTDAPKTCLTKEKGNSQIRPALGRPDVLLEPEEAQEILRVATQLDMPGLMRLSLVFALFKTYAIPSISDILIQSGQLSTAENVSRRYADTGILIANWMNCPFVDFSRMNLKEEDVDSRSAIAVARVNWLHKRWPSIKNEDLLYTMSLFVLEPMRWAKTYGWRELLPIEQEAYFVMWKEIGRRMNIEDIPETLDGLLEWSENYEETAMVTDPSNYKVGDHTLNYVLAGVTERFGIRKFMRNVMICILEDRVRIAFMLPEPNPFVRRVTSFLMRLFAIRHRYLSLPRYTNVEYTPRKVPARKLAEKMPRLHPTQFDRVPWYKPEPTGLGWLTQMALLKLGILEEELVPSPKFKSSGYRLEECGPVALEQVGHADVMQMAAEIQGCPVTGVWAR